jgi:uncharacterized membrane protein
MEPGIALLLWLAALLLIVAPILAISAFLRVRKLEEKQRHGGASEANERLWRLEQRVQGVEKALERLYQQGVTPQTGAPQSAVTRPAASEVPPADTAQIPPAAARVTPPAAPPISAPPPAPVPAASAQAQIPAPRSPLQTPQPTKHVGRAAPHVGAVKPPEDLETVVAGRWLNYVGIIAILFAAAFFIEYAFENAWVGPRGRISIGILCGVALLAGSDFLLRRGYEYFSEGIAALGAALLYLSLWGGWHYYTIFSADQVFAGMIVITAVMAAVSLGRDSQRLALLALIGGFLTPGLVSTGGDHEVVLFVYTAILSAGMMTLQRFRRWPWLPPLAFVATEIYFWGWYEVFYTAEKFALTMTFAALFFVLFAALPVMRARGAGRLNEGETIVAIGNVAVFLLALHQMLWPDHRWGLTLAFLVVAAAHIVVLRVLPEAPRHDSPGSVTGVRPLFGGLALVSISLAIPARLDGEWLTMAWAAEGLLLVWCGVRMASGRLRAAGLLFFAITAMRLIVLRVAGGAFLWNDRFMTYAVSVACFTLGCFFVREIAPEFDQSERAAFAALSIAANVYALVALSQEIWDYFGRAHGLGIERWLAQQLGLSIFWTLYATALILTGMARRAAILRWQALTLFAIVVAKVFFYDLSTLSRFYRILSFLVLGVLLLSVSFLYQRRSLAQKEKAP